MEGSNTAAPKFYLKPRLNEIVLRTMKSSLRSDEIFGSASDEMKFAIQPTEGGFHREAISSREAGFHSPKPHRPS